MDNLQGAGLSLVLSVRRLTVSSLPDAAVRLIRITRQDTMSEQTERKRPPREVMDEAFLADLLDPDDWDEVYLDSDVLVWTKEYLRSQVGAPLSDTERPHAPLPTTRQQRSQADCMEHGCHVANNIFPLRASQDSALPRLGACVGLNTHTFYARALGGHLFGAEMSQPFKCSAQLSKRVLVWLNPTEVCGGIGQPEATRCIQGDST